MKANAKIELLSHLQVADRVVKCMTIRDVATRTDHCLRIGYDVSEWASFIDGMDFEYEVGAYDVTNLNGTIWYTDGTWSERPRDWEEEGWLYMVAPEIPKELMR